MPLKPQRITKNKITISSSIWTNTNQIGLGSPLNLRIIPWSSHRTRIPWDHCLHHPCHPGHPAPSHLRHPWLFYHPTPHQQSNDRNGSSDAQAMFEALDHRIIYFNYSCWNSYILENKFWLTYKSSTLVLLSSRVAKLMLLRLYCCQLICEKIPTLIKGEQVYCCPDLRIGR